MAPAAVGILLVTDPDLIAAWVEHGSRSVVAAITAVTIGVAMTAALSWLIFRLRFVRLIKAAEEIAAGD